MQQAYLDSRNRAYVRAKRMLEKSGDYVVNNEAEARNGKKKNIRVAQSYIESILPLNAATSSYVFNIMDNQINQGNAGILAQERRLKLQDVFFTSAIGFYLTTLTFSGGYSNNQFELFAYPPPGFVGPLPLIPDLISLFGIWAGTLEVRTNGEIVTPYWRLQQHLAINQTQSSGGSSVYYPQTYDQINYSEDGMIVTEPNWILNGGNNNLYTVNYGNYWNNVLGTNNAGTALGFGIVMIWDGWLAQNASSIMDNATAKM